MSCFSPYFSVCSTKNLSRSVSPLSRLLPLYSQSHLATLYSLSVSSTFSRSFSQAAAQSIPLITFPLNSNNLSFMSSSVTSAPSSPSPSSASYAAVAPLSASASFPSSASATLAVSSLSSLSIDSTSLPGRPSSPSSFWEDVYWKIRSVWIPSDHAKLEESEKKILKMVRKPFQQKFVDIGNDLFINTVHFQSSPSTTSAASPVSASASSSSAAVLLHGYAGGIGSWARNYDSFSSLFPSLYSIDWLGTGRSARPPWTAKGVEASEAFFVESLENWRKANGLSSLELVGHSMGGYLASAYTLRYPQHVSRLILLSPVGMPRKDPAANERWNQLSLTRRMLFGTLRWLFMSGVTPNDVVKFIGPLGSRPVNGYFANRFQFANRDNYNGTHPATADGVHVPSYDKETYATYHYHNLALERSGDAVLSQVLGENVFAHQPMIDRLPAVLVEHNIPTSFVYGDHDWMDVRCGKTIAEMVVEGQKRRWQEKASGASFHVCEDAGHQLFIENPEGVYQAMKELLKLPAKRS